MIVNLCSNELRVQWVSPRCSMHVFSLCVSKVGTLFWRNYIIFFQLRRDRWMHGWIVQGTLLQIRLGAIGLRFEPSKPMSLRYLLSPNKCFHASYIIAVPSPRGALVGLAPQTKLQPPKNWNMKHYKLAEFLSSLNVKPLLNERNPPRHKRKAPLLTTFW